MPTPNHYQNPKLVRFAYCDPAGIIFYPQYFMLLHEVKEDWFREGLHYDFGNMLLGERVDFALTIAHLGSASLHVDYACACAGETRMQARTVLVMTSLATRRPTPIHAPLRAAIERFMGGE